MIVKNEFRSIVGFLLVMVMMGVACGFMWARLRDPLPISRPMPVATAEPISLAINENTPMQNDAFRDGGQAKINEVKTEELSASVEDLLSAQEQNENLFTELITGLSSLDEGLEGIGERVQSVEDWQATHSCEARLGPLEVEVSRQEHEIQVLKTSGAAVVISLGAVSGIGLTLGMKTKKRVAVLEGELLHQRSRLARLTARQDHASQPKPSLLIGLPDEDEPVSVPW